VAQRWDVFVSYAHEDEAWVRVLVENLHRAGRDVFFDQWDVVGGSLLSQRLQQGLASAGAVVLVVSRAAVGKPWWQEEFAAAMAGVMASVQRLIPVLLDDVPLPPFMASRVWVDFRHLDAPAQYEARCADLLRAVQGIAPGDRPQRGGGIVVPPGVYRAEGSRAARLRIDQQRVVFSCADREWSHPPLGVDGGLRTLVWEVERARARAGDSVVVKAPDAALPSRLHHQRETRQPGRHRRHLPQPRPHRPGKGRLHTSRATLPGRSHHQRRTRGPGRYHHQLPPARHHRPVAGGLRPSRTALPSLAHHQRETRQPGRYRHRNRSARCIANGTGPASRRNSLHRQLFCDIP
jgi:TIR domain